ncbi:MAG: hypothetical protein KKI08_19270, partial [Armatimonadetes bacterium]|nr:hypothetical protein [Armatimonadota bacterium]
GPVSFADTPRLLATPGFTTNTAPAAVGAELKRMSRIKAKDGEDVIGVHVNSLAHILPFILYILPFILSILSSSAPSPANQPARRKALHWGPPFAILLFPPHAVRA